MSLVHRRVLLWGLILSMSFGLMGDDVRPPVETGEVSKLTRLPPRDWVIFLSSFLSERGRIVDIDNGNITHSEAMGYGMLLAVAFQDQETFDRLWRWTADNLQVRDDKLFAWRWAPTPLGGEVTDFNNASDGDILIAWALLRATRLWEDSSYAEHAVEILNDLEEKCIISTPFGLLLLPGEFGFMHDRGVVVNPSYYIFPALEDFARWDQRPDSPWSRVLRDGLRLMEEARFTQANLPADWVLLGDRVMPAPDFPPYFGFDAIRVPLNIAWWNQRNSLLNPVVDFWDRFPHLRDIPAKVSLRPDLEDSEYPVSPGMRAVIVFSQATRRGRQLDVNQLPGLTRGEGYYSAALNLLTKMAILDQQERAREMDAMLP